MHASIVIAFLLATLCHQNEALTCRECVTEERCKHDLSKCLHGLVKDACDCCDICAKGPGESCGGMWNLYGTCGKGLACLQPISDQDREPCVEGLTCRPTTLRPNHPSLDEAPGTCSAIPPLNTQRPK